MIPEHPRVVVMIYTDDVPHEILARTRTALRRHGVHWQEIESFTARALSGDRDTFDSVIDMTVTVRRVPISRFSIEGV